MSELEPIWPCGKKIRIIGVTGPYWSGKSMFGCLIDPLNTLCFDFEMSCEDYEYLGFERISLPDVMHEKHSVRKDTYKPIDIFEEWYKRLLKIPSGKYSVIMVDPISDIEDGMVSWVKNRYKEFGFNSTHSFEKMEGVFWGIVKAEWKRILLGDLASRCQTFLFTTHLKKVWKHNKPTTESMPKGKVTLFEISQLYLYLERDTKRADVPPSAEVLKARITSHKVDDEGCPILDSRGNKIPRTLIPQRLPVATPDAIRDLILNPLDFDNLLDNGALQYTTKERVLSTDERLELQKEISDGQLETSKISLEKSQTDTRLEAAKEAARQRARGKAKPDTNNVLVLQEWERSDDGTEVTEDEARKLLDLAPNITVVQRMINAAWNLVIPNHPSLSRDNDASDQSYVFRYLTRKEYHKFLSGIEKINSEK